jgi:hypothetical protein
MWLVAQGVVLTKDNMIKGDEETLDVISMVQQKLLTIFYLLAWLPKLCGG